MNLPSDEITALRQRLDQLERSNRGLKRLGLLAFLGVGLTFLMGQAGPGNRTPEVIEAQRFVVKDPSGRSLAALGLDRDGAPLLVLTHTDGTLAAALDVTTAKRSALTLYDKAGKSRAVMGVDPDGSPGISLNDKNESPRVGLAVASQGSGGLVLYGDGNTARASLGLGTNWSPYLVFLDASGNLRTALGQTEAFPPALTKTFNLADFSMVMLSAKGEMVWNAAQKATAPATTQSKAVTKSKPKSPSSRR